MSYDFDEREDHDSLATECDCLGALLLGAFVGLLTGAGAMSLLF
jgi:hypothetical protein